MPLNDLSGNGPLGMGLRLGRAITARQREPPRKFTQYDFILLYFQG